MCTGRVDLAFIFRAFLKGADGVIIGGCWPGECHYVTEGNYDALGNMHLSRMLLELIGVRPERLRIKWIAASEGNRFAEEMSSFAAKIKELGSIAQNEGIDEVERTRKINAVHRIIPYVKLLEREKLRVPIKSEEAYNAFYESVEVTRLFKDVVGQKLAISQILSLLEERPLSTGEISDTLRLTPSEVSTHMNTSSRQGLVWYDVQRSCYALA